jgi:hypothetical protein
MDPLSDRLRGLPELEPPRGLNASVLKALRADAASERLPEPAQVGWLEGTACAAVTAAYAIFAVANTVSILFG